MLFIFFIFPRSTKYGAAEHRLRNPDLSYGFFLSYSRPAKTLILQKIHALYAFESCRALFYSRIGKELVVLIGQPGRVFMQKILILL
jgi:hypothetical protein